MDEASRTHGEGGPWALMTVHRSLKIALALVMTGVVDIISIYSPTVIGPPRGGFIPPSFITHTLMWGLSLVLMGLLSRGRLADFGFCRGTFRFTPRILLWALPTAALSLLSTLAPPGASGTKGPGEGFSVLQTVLFIWIYASISEEILTRGLLQGCLSMDRQVASRVSTRLRLSQPVILSGLFFGAMHLVLIPIMGPAAVPLIILAVFLGLVAGFYRERTGSLLPAIIVHALFNIGGTVPVWLIQWMRGMGV